MKQKYRIIKETQGDKVRFFIEVEMENIGWKLESFWRNHDTIESARSRVKDLQDRDAVEVVCEVVEVFDDN